MGTEETVNEKSKLPICVKVMLIILVVLVIVGITGGLLCWLL